MPLKLRRLSYNIGAEVVGLDVSQPLADAVIKQICEAWLEHGILLFRGTVLTRAQHIDFSRRFGKLDPNEEWPTLRHPDYPEILTVTHRPASKAQQSERDPSRGTWHSDRSYTLAPSKGSLLRPIDYPEVGGDTLFANMSLAYETLSDGMKQLIEGLHGVHVGGKQRVDEHASDREAAMKRINPAVAQPLVRVHPETGRKALNLGDKVSIIVGMTAEESRPLLDFLCDHATHTRFCYRHQWRNDDLMMWDNRCIMHNYLLGDYDRNEVRHMERTTLIGTPSGYRYDGPL
jgi:taurine dioxygenase